MNLHKLYSVMYGTICRDLHNLDICKMSTKTTILFHRTSLITLYNTLMPVLNKYLHYQGDKVFIFSTQ